MSLEKFRADLKYSSTSGDYEVNFRNTPKCDAPQTLVNLIEHLCWMAVIAGRVMKLVKLSSAVLHLVLNVLQSSQSVKNQKKLKRNKTLYEHFNFRHRNT